MSSVSDKSIRISRPFAVPQEQDLMCLHKPQLNNGVGYWLDRACFVGGI